MKKYKIVTTIFAKLCVQFIFTITKTLLPVNKKKVVFASYRSEKLTGNLLYVYNEFLSRNYKFKYIFLMKKYKSSILGKLDYFIHLIVASYHLATSKLFVIDDYYFPVYVIKPRKDTSIIQLWHAAGAFKKFGHSTIGKDFGPSKDYLQHVKVHSNYSYAIVSASEVIPYFAEAFNMPEDRILPLGVPRTDYFFDKNEERRLKDRFYKEYPSFSKKRILLYAPTFRGKSHHQKKFECPLDFGKLKESCNGDFILLIHLHPYMKGKLDIQNTVRDFVYIIDENYTIEELMSLSDLLITDYSSVIFDYSLLKRPIVFFATDLEEYLKERGFYYSFKEFIPGPFFEKTEDLAEYISKWDFDLNKIVEFRNRFFDFIDGKASERVVDFLLEN